MANFFDQFDAPAAPAAQPQQSHTQNANGWNDPAYLAQVYDWQRRAGLTTEAAATYRRMLDLNGSGEQTRYSTTPQYGYNENGDAVALQFGNDGTVRQSPLPTGITLNPKPTELDGGTHTIIVNPITGQEIGRYEKNVGAAASQQAAGRVQGETQATRALAAPSQVQAADNSLELLGKIRNDPNMEYGTGAWSYLNGIRGTDAYDFNNIVEQAKGGAFLTAVEQLRGMGALSNTEGQAATAATNRMNVATSKEAFLDALADYEKIVMQGRTKAQAIVDGTAQPILDDASNGQSAPNNVEAGAPRGLLGVGAQQFDKEVPTGAAAAGIPTVSGPDDPAFQALNSGDKFIWNGVTKTKR